MSPFVRKPTKPATRYRASRSFSAFYQTWYADGRPRNSGTKTDDIRYEGSEVLYRSSNPPSWKGGLIWRNPSNYSSVFYTINPREGISMHTNDKGARMTLIEGVPVGISYQTWAPRFVDSSTWLALTMPSNMKARIDTELMLKVGARKTNYGEAIAESRETVKHLATTVTSLVRAALAARRGKFRDVAKHLGVPFKRTRGRTISKKWLEYQYAWLPMMSDIYDTKQLLDKGLREKNQIMSSVRVIRETDSLNVSPGKGERWQERHMARCSAWCDYKAKVYYRVNDSSISALHQLGLINPLEVAWAVVPFSFVVDWFVPVGNVLEALTARFGVDFIGGFYGIKVESNSLIYPRFTSLWGPILSYEPSTVTMATETNISAYRRIRMTGFPIPMLYYKNPFSLSHVTSALALVRQLLR